MLSRLTGGSGRPRACPAHHRSQAASAPWGPAVARAAHAQRRRPRTVAVRAERSLYEVLGVEPAANDRDIKRAYRQKALKLHPDVNKEPDAEARFMEVKAAFSVLSDPTQRADYDRRRRSGSWGGWRPGGGADYGWGGSSSGGAGAGAGAGQRRPKSQEEEFYGLGDLAEALGRDLSGALSGAARGLADLGQGLASRPGAAAEFLQRGAGGVAGWAREQAGRAKADGLEDFFRDLEKEADSWAEKRSAARKDGGKDRPLSLWEELAAIGGEFVEYLESTLPSEEESGGGSGPGGKRSPLDEYESLKRRYKMDGQEAAEAEKQKQQAQAKQAQAKQQQQQAQAQAQPPPKAKTADEEVDEMLAALKKKLGKS
ncbi:hypothetical protein Rsub_07568 [Raphidocelis subcapitata]|uniref:J domain-containing protein n=1 Tax=Raphidocelis subcapitata TaxID=307507 RepID=A0A2V0PD24_9CHLO|nr:hypothetical protein Rsub_07568 [Raphidocelis subcapitata]|eukprot:GBF95067.1 hypothetical protein Rsub_07568 [Raphidocelis subcapitata]